MNPYTLRNEDFIDTINVVCPKCKKQAKVVGGTPYGKMAQHEIQVRFTVLPAVYPNGQKTPNIEPNC